MLQNKIRHLLVKEMLMVIDSTSATPEAMLNGLRREVESEGLSELSEFIWRAVKTGNIEFDTMSDVYRKLYGFADQHGDEDLKSGYGHPDLSGLL